MKQRLKRFAESVVNTAERYRSLPDKVIDTNFLFLVQMMLGLLLEAAVLSSNFSWLTLVLFLSFNYDSSTITRTRIDFW